MGSKQLSQQERNAVLTTATRVLNLEADALLKASQRIDDSFTSAVNAILQLRGKLVVTGLGKSGHIASKLAATFASTGTPAFFLHPSEALHGDLGMLSTDDGLLALAQGGETDETVEVAKYARRLGIPVVVITGKAESRLASLAHYVIDSSVQEEACPLKLAPTTSSTLALALGDAMAVSLMHCRGFTEERFASVHPGGSLGRRLMLVGDIMHLRSEIGVVSIKTGFTEVMERITKPNYGVVAVVGESDQVVGVITDGDIRRSLAKFAGGALNMTAQDLMSARPRVIAATALAVDAFQVMERAKITSLLVVEDPAVAEPKLLGLVRMHDLLEHKIV